MSRNYQRNAQGGPAGAPAIPDMEADGKPWKRREAKLEIAGGAAFNASGLIEHAGKAWEPGSFALINTGAAVISRKQGDPHAHIVLFDDGASLWARPTADGQAIETLTADPAPAIATIRDESKPEETKLPEKVWVYHHLIDSVEPLQALLPNGTFTVKGLKGRYFGDPESPIDVIAENYRIFSRGGRQRTIRIQSLHSDYGYSIFRRSRGEWCQICLADPQPKEQPRGELFRGLLFGAAIAGLLFLLSLFSPGPQTVLFVALAIGLFVTAVLNAPDVFLWDREDYMPTMPPLTPPNNGAF